MPDTRGQFRTDYQPPEGWIVGYTRAEHRMLPATESGPRLLVRLSLTSVNARNSLCVPSLF